jgi:endoglucanase
MLDEMGVLNRDNLQYRVAWTEFYVSYARENGIPCFWWDNGSYWPTRIQEWGWDETFGLLNRETNQIAHPQIVAALMRATE